MKWNGRQTVKLGAALKQNNINLFMLLMNSLSLLSNERNTGFMNEMIFWTHSNDARPFDFSKPVQIKIITGRNLLKILQYFWKHFNKM